MLPYVDAEQSVLEKLRKCINAIRSSPQRRDVFKKQCDVVKCKFNLPILDISVRWNSTFDMVERALEIRAGLQATLQAKEDLKEYLLSDDEWDSLRVLRDFLKPIKEATLMISKEKTPNVASSTMIFQHLFTHFDRCMKNPTADASIVPSIAKAAKQKLEKYYPESDGKAYVVGTGAYAYTCMHTVSH